MNSIQFKIIILVILSMLLVTSVIGIVYVQESSDVYDIETRDRLIAETEKYTSEFNNQIWNVEQVAINVELLVESMFDFDALKTNPNYMNEFEEIIAPVIKNIASLGKETKSAYVFFTPSLDGEAHDVWYSDLNYNNVIDRQEEFPKEYYEDYILGREWFFEPFNTRQVYWTDPYVGNAEYDNHIIYMSHTRPVIVKGEVIAVVGSDFHYNIMKEYISSIQMDNKGYAFLLNENADTLIHPTLSENEHLRNISEGKYKWISDEFLSKESGYIKYDWINGQEKLLAFSRLKNGWTFGLTLDRSEALDWIKDLQFKVGLIAMGLVIMISIIGYKLGRLITQPLNELTEHVKVIGDGDYYFAIPQKLLNRSDETGKLANSIEVMRNLQRNSFEQIKEQNSNLEVEISKRTKSLKESRDSLQVSLNENKLKNESLLLLNNRLEKTVEDMVITQRQLIESEKIASLSFLVTRLAHEFNTPIGNLTTLLSFIAEEMKKIEKKFIGGKLKKDDMSCFIEKYNETNHMLSNNLSRIKMLVSRFIELNPDTHFTVTSSINLSNFVDVVIDTIHVEHEHIGIEVICTDDLEVEVDAGKLSQIFGHLLENSVVHGFEGCDSGLIIVDIEKEESSLKICIKDNGVGMPKNVMDHIFVPFYTGNINTKTSGLGLNIVYNIVTKIFGGEITCNSVVDEGTEFVIVINL